MAVCQGRTMPRVAWFEDVDHRGPPKGGPFKNLAAQQYLEQRMKQNGVCFVSSIVFP